MADKPKAKRILGVDFGLRRFGVALSDEMKIIATPIVKFEAEKRSEQTVKKFVELIRKIEHDYRCEIEEIVLGLPLMMSGKTGFLADEVKHFAKLLGHLTPIPIKLWDERLTSVQADRALREGEFTRKRRSQMVDTVAAVIILQSYLSCLSIQNERDQQDSL